MKDKYYCEACKSEKRVEVDTSTWKPIKKLFSIKYPLCCDYAFRKTMADSEIEKYWEKKGER